MSYPAVSSSNPPGQSEFARHWRLLAAATAGVSCSSVVLPYYSIGVLLQPVTAEFGWTHAQFQWAILFSATLGALTGPVVGWLVDRYGVRRVALPGLLGLGLGFFMAAAMDGSLWMFYSAYACMAVLGAGTTPITWTRALAAKFHHRRGLALGLALSGTGICAMIAPRFTLWFVESFGWRSAYVALGLLPILFAAPLVWWGCRDESSAPASVTVEPPQHGLSPREALRGQHFWILLLSILFAYLAISGIGPNLIPALTDKGLPVGRAALLLGLMGAAIVAARIVVGLLVDRFWAPAVAFCSLLLPMAGCLILADTRSPAMQTLAVVLLGFGAGAELDLMSYLTARYFGVRHYGRIYAVLYAALALCSGVAPALFATVRDRSGSYDTAFLGAALLFALGAATVLGLGRYPDFSSGQGSSN